MRNPTIDSIDRETLAFALGFKCHGHKNRTDQAADMQHARDKLRALLDAPAVHPELGSAPADHMAGLLALVLNPGSYPIDVLHKQIRSTLDVIGKPAAHPQGEPVAWLNVATGHVTTSAVVVMDWDDEKEQVKSLYSEQPAPQKYDDTLLPFLAMMRKELHANTGKGDREGWLGMSSATALAEVKHHVLKLENALADAEGDLIKEHAADVANCAMMLADVCGVLPE